MTRTLLALAALIGLSGSPAFANYAWELPSTTPQLVGPSKGATQPTPYEMDEKGYGDLVTSRTEERPTTRIDAVRIVESPAAVPSLPGGFHNR